MVAIALAFDFTNGFHDAANSIATVVSIRVLTPRLAVVWAAFFNFVAFLIFKTHVANTIAKDVVLQDVLSIGVVFAGLLGAIVWNLLTYWAAIPSSSSHALVGGMAGAAVAKAGGHVLVGPLVGHEHVVHLPELSLRASGFGRFGSEFGVFVDVDQGKVPKHEGEIVAECADEFAHHRFRLTTVGAFEVAVLDEDDPGVGRTPDMVDLGIERCGEVDERAGQVVLACGA
jgi:hypothetical protein